MLLRHGVGLLIFALLPPIAAAQDIPGATAPPVYAPPVYAPPTTGERVTWVIEGSTSLPALLFNAVGAGMATQANWPKEWGRGIKGLGFRFADEEGYATACNAIEAGVGAIWSEDPRYHPSAHRGLRRRARHALLATIVAPRRDGHLAPAWGRFGAIAATMGIENAWLPPSAKTPGQTAWRVADDLSGRLLSNLWDEFWPDVRGRLPVPLR